LRLVCEQPRLRFLAQVPIHRGRLKCGIDFPVFEADSAFQ